jgi:DNA repair protein RadC
LERRVKYDAKPPGFDSPSAVRDYLRLRLNDLDREEFWCVWLDAANRPIDAECMFVGTLTKTSVYPREVVRRALGLNAAAVIFAHNHPSGKCEPSRADRDLTSALTQALGMVDVRALDHFIIGSDPAPTSFAELGLM